MQIVYFLGNLESTAYLSALYLNDFAENTAPLGVCFYDDLESKQEEVYKHYLGRSLAEQPVMYLLSPKGFDGEVSLVLPTEGGLKRRSIQEFNATLN